MKALIIATLTLMLLVACSTKVTTPLQEQPPLTPTEVSAVDDSSAPADTDITPNAEQELSLKDMDELDSDVSNIEKAFS